MNDTDTFLNEVNEPLKDKDPIALEEDSETQNMMNAMLLSTRTSYEPPVLPDTSTN